jgi:CRP-like cAMP-binding protein/thioredoxin reductase/Fe-S-cluster-containing dehydrogenase component
MTDQVSLAIVGAGPAGLSAAMRAAEVGISHILLEAADRIANTVGNYQKGKQVMAEPAILPLRSSLGFAAASREQLLIRWNNELASSGARIRTGAALTSLVGQRGGFRLMLASGETIAADNVVLAFGLQGNIRRLEVPGAELPGIQYQLDDPDEYKDETILVVGGGDAGVENALALAEHNRVLILNRLDEFTACGETNFERLRESLASGRIEAFSNASVLRIEARPHGEFPLNITIDSPQGIERLECHRVIARLGALPARGALEHFGIRFPSAEATAVPELSEHYESNVPGLYVIGSLAGYPLIKQSLNQGYEVVEHLRGHPVAPADENLLWAKLNIVPGITSVSEGIKLLREQQPLLGSLTTLQLREFLQESVVLASRPGDVIFRRNDFGNSFFSILRGNVAIHLENDQGSRSLVTLSAGDYFGEIGLLSGRRRSATVVAGDDCVLVDTPRRAMLKLLDSAPGVERQLGEVSLKRVVRQCFGTALPAAEVEHLVQGALVRRFAAGETLFNEGDEADGLYMIRRGSVTISRWADGKEVVAAYVSAGSYIGEMALISRSPRTATVRAAAPTEVVLLEAARFNAVLDLNPAVRGEISARYLEGIRNRELGFDGASGKQGKLIEFLMNEGGGEATDMLLIDYARCIRCDNCERACAAVHDGSPRLDRAAGKTFNMIHVPVSCRHCEHPRCMKDCPVDAIHRSLLGEVYIGDNCIGCGNCQSNCPYGVIQMASNRDYRPPSLLQIILGRPARADAKEMTGGERAVKCDMCMGIVGEAACVRACPTGAAFRVSPEQFLALGVG